MAHVRYGTLTPPRQRWKHLKAYKRDHHKRERRTWRRAVKAMAGEAAA